MVEAVIDIQKILLVDDRKENLLTLSKILSSENHLIETANSGTQALEKCLTTDYDLFIIDVQMEDMDGFELASRLKESKKVMNVPVIFVSAKYQEDHHVTTGFETGAVDYIFMPFKKDLIKLKVTAFLQLRKQQKELENLTYHLSTKNKELTQFSYMVSHDLKGPLRGISNLLQWISEDISDQSEQIKEYAGLATTKVAYMDNLISGLLEYSKAGAQNIEPEKANLKDLISDAISGMSVPYNFTINIAEDLPEVFCHKILLQQVIGNLILNSIQHNDKEKGLLEISCEKTHDELIVSFSDNGPGVPEHLSERVFEIFNTGKKNTDMITSGVGLAIVRKLLTKMGGSVWIDTEFDEGARFVITLPIVGPN